MTPRIMDSRPVAGGEETGGPAWHFALILTLMAILIAGNIYFYWATNHLEQRLNQLEASVQTDLAAVRVSGGTFAAATAKNIDDLRSQFDSQRTQMIRTADQANRNATRHANELARRLQSEQRKTQEQLASALGEMRQAASSNSARVGEVSNRVTAVGAQVSDTRSTVDRVSGDLKNVQGDLGVQRGLIATNAKELAALRALGDRNYINFDLRKTGEPQRIANINVVVRKTDPKRNRFTLDVIADDKMVEKKDRSVNEPVQFYVSRSRQPYELVVNEVQHERIIGYLAVPKVASPAR